MIGLTDKAKQEILGILLTDNEKNPGTCIRLGANEEGKLGLHVDIAKPDDKSVEYNGVKVLVVEESLADELENLAIDIIEGEEGKQFVIVKKPENN